MIWSGELVVGLGLILTPGVDPPAGVADRVRAAVARHWNTSTEQIRLEWGRWATRESVADSAPFRLLGGGRDGRFVVALRTAKGGETAVAVRAGVVGPAWIAARSVPPGRRLEAADLTRTERLVWGPPAAPNGPAPIGWETRRGLAAGDPVTEASVEQPALIEPGDPVSFVWEREGFRVVRAGVATVRARLGQRVTGRPERSGPGSPNGDQLVGVVLGRGLARLEGKGRR
jgi:flagella basal body P-ring formation protein FlgA